MELLFILVKYCLYFMKILIEKYGSYFLTQKTVVYDKYGLNYFIELVARSVTSATSRIELVILNELWSD